MIFYRVNSAVPYLVATQADAKRDARMCKCDWEQVDIPTDKLGLMAYLNGLELVTAVDCEHNPLFIGDPDTPANEFVGLEPRYAAAPKLPSYLDASLAIDEQFEKLPLAHQLGLAAGALERAREAQLLA